MYEHELPKLTEGRSAVEEELDLQVFKSVWEGAQTHEYGEIAVTETMGIALYTLGECSSYEEAMILAADLWSRRHTSIQ